MKSPDAAVTIYTTPTWLTHTRRTD